MALEETHATEQSTAITDDAMDGIVVLEEYNDASIGSYGTCGTPGSLLTTTDFTTILSQCQILAHPTLLHYSSQMSFFGSR